MTDEITIQQKNSIKLIKGTKGMNWEIKVIGDKTDGLVSEIKKINEELTALYGKVCNTESE